MTRSRYNILQLSGILLACGLFLSGGIVVLQKNAAGIFCLVFAGYFLFIFFERAPGVILTPEAIIIKYPFRKESRTWSEIVNVEMNIKAPYKVLYIFTQYMEAMVIHFENEKKVVLFNDMYRNLPAIKAALKERMGAAGSEVKPVARRFFGTEKYAGNPFVTVNTLTMAGLVGIFLYLFKEHYSSRVFGAESIVLAFFYIFSGWQMNYFEIDNDVLVIRNHYFPWKRKTYYLSDISEAAVEHPHKRSISLRVITNNQESKLFGAGSLREKHWDKLTEDLRSIGIKVRRDE